MGRGATLLPLGIELSSTLTARGAPPYSETTSNPLPLFARYAPRNTLRAADYVAWDVRVSRVIHFESV